MTSPTVRGALLRIVASTPIGHVLRALAPQRATVLTYHRFVPDQCGDPSFTRASSLRAHLAYLRRHRYRITSLLDLLSGEVADRSRFAGTVAITVDDGYADLAEVALPILREFDCPATVFVSTGPVDRLCWLWWDRVQAAVEKSKVTEVRIECEGLTVSGSWGRDVDARRRGVVSLCEALKRAPTVVREMSIDALLTALEVELPASPSIEFRAMTWDQIRQCERAGISIGGHTVTHPILARCDDPRATWEITEGVGRLRTECATPIETFAYPNGGPGDFGDREVSVLRDNGIVGACTTARGYVTPTMFGDGADVARYRVPRVSDPVTLSGLIRAVSGRA